MPAGVGDEVGVPEVIHRSGNRDITAPDGGQRLHQVGQVRSESPPHGNTRVSRRDELEHGEADAEQDENEDGNSPPHPGGPVPGSGPQEDGPQNQGDDQAIDTGLAEQEDDEGQEEILR